MLDAVWHTWLLADLAEVEDSFLHVVLRNLRCDLVEVPSVDATFYATRLTQAADRL